MAPVNAPRSWPNNSDSISVSEKTAQLTGTNGLWRRALDTWSRFAITSFPDPVSPVMSTLLSLSAMTLTKSTIARMRAFRPTMMESAAKVAWGTGPTTSSRDSPLSV